MCDRLFGRTRHCDSRRYRWDCVSPKGYVPKCASTLDLNCILNALGSDESHRQICDKGDMSPNTFADFQ